MDIKTSDINRFLKGFIDYLSTHHREFMENLDKSGESTAGTDQILLEAMESFKRIFEQNKGRE
jgi:F-type H+-transporting ATPase subunit alpha